MNPTWRELGDQVGDTARPASFRAFDPFARASHSSGTAQEGDPGGQAARFQAWTTIALPLGDQLAPSTSRSVSASLGAISTALVPSRFATSTCRLSDPLRGSAGARTIR